MNIYRGCTHGCIYCDSRSKCYHVENFDEIHVKENALKIIEKELASKKYTGVVGTGAMSDPYNVCEKKLMLTRGALKLLDKFKFGVGICTKGIMVKRDKDILSKISAHSPVTICMTITAANDAVSKVIEPNAPLSSARFEAVRELNEAGIYTGILMMPLLMDITDSPANINGLIDRAHETNVPFIYPAFGLSMRDGNREYLYKNLDEKFPGLRVKYQQCYGSSYICNIPEAKSRKNLFMKKCNAAGIKYGMGEIIEGAQQRVKNKQTSFWGN